MNTFLPQTTTDWIFYIINAFTFVFAAINLCFRQDFDGASNEMVVAFVFEHDKYKKLTKNQKKKTLLFRIMRIVAIIGCIIAVIVLILRKANWVFLIAEACIIIQAIVILINCFSQADHNFTKYEQYWINFVAVSLVLQKLPLGLGIKDIAKWQSLLPEGIRVTVQSFLWLVQIFMLLMTGLLSFNALCKKKKKINRIGYARFSWNIGDWYIKHVDKSTFLKILFPIIWVSDTIFYLIKKAILFCAAMFNELLPSINGAIQRQVDTLDTQLIRLAFRASIVCSLSMMYGYMELKGNHAESTKNVFSYVATVIVIPIVIEGILGLRERIKEQSKPIQVIDSLEDTIKEAVIKEMELKEEKKNE